MPTITKIQQQKRRPNRRSVYLDGSFAFGCNLNVVAKFRLRDGMELSTQQLEQIQKGEITQECFDAAIRFLQRRLHSRKELKNKLMRKDWSEGIIETVLDNLARLEYLDDSRFAKAKASSAAKHKHHGRRRAFMELMRSGVEPETADRALGEVYAASDPTAMIRTLVEKQMNRVKKLDPPVARRRLLGMLQRRGFDYETAAPIIREMLGGRDEEQAS